MQYNYFMNYKILESEVPSSDGIPEESSYPNKKNQRYM